MVTREPRWGAGGAPTAGLAKGREPPREWTWDPDPQRARAPTGLTGPLLQGSWAQGALRAGVPAPRDTALAQRQKGRL